MYVTRRRVQSKNIARCREQDGQDISRGLPRLAHTAVHLPLWSKAYHLQSLSPVVHATEHRGTQEPTAKENRAARTRCHSEGSTSPSELRQQLLFQRFPGLGAGRMEWTALA